MFAIIQTGAKQYKVKKGDTIEIDTFAGKEVKEGQTLHLENVLLVADGKETQIGKPLVEGVKVEAKVLAEMKSDKILVFKMKAKKRYQKTQGHRQNLLKVEIVDIKQGASKAAPKAETAEKSEEAPKKKAVKKEEA